MDGPEARETLFREVEMICLNAAVDRVGRGWRSDSSIEAVGDADKTGSGRVTRKKARLELFWRMGRGRGYAVLKAACCRGQPVLDGSWGCPFTTR